MPDAKTRREMARSYKDRLAVGGVFRFVHKDSGWASKPRATQNMDGENNKLRLYKTAGEPSDIELLKPWREHGGDGFDIEWLDVLERKEGQSSESFREDVNTLLKMRQDEA